MIYPFIYTKNGKKDSVKLITIVKKCLEVAV